MLAQFGKVKRQCGNERRRKDQWCWPRAARLVERPMALVWIVTEADVLGTLWVEKVEASQEDPLRQRTLWRGMARHPLMLRYGQYF